MAAKRHEPIKLEGLELRASADGEAYIIGASVGGAFLPISDLKAGYVDLALDEDLQRQQEAFAAEQASIAPEPGTVSRIEPAPAPPGTPGDSPEPEQPTGE